ncbi:MAG: N-acetylmuramoyl-L-alanine amidase [Candidatus Faecisoma sp.]|nr:N-acetylmuramoyl-L-alanine amidase [Acholeplasma sp.]MCI5677499.1 N-acetylmuramoyl-L-alanine amidase [Acholeplasma sp.]MDY2892163.1 N-acetylmuramoyl-L-alanine amidase [Candidatus Faecisoma sp.]
MKYRNYCLILFLLFLFSLGLVKAKELPLIGKVIYLDPGHGGSDPGAVYGNIYEANLNLEIALKTQKELEKQGAIVYLTRYGDYDLSVKNAQLRKRSDLSRRANAINKSLCDMYLSIHLNADSDTTWRGAQVFFDDVNKNNVKLAEIMQNTFKKNLNTNRKYKQVTNQYMYRRINRLGVLLEVGFISNPNERYLLQKEEYQEKIAKTITEGINNYFNT